jgi:pimeloyl-ACP methyl ester carboxylesterase
LEQSNVKLKGNVVSDALIGERIHLRQGIDLQVCYTEGKTPAIVFLHGGLGNRFNWRSQYEFFQSGGREVVAYDLAGHGQSVPYRRYSLGRHCRDLTRLLHKLHIQSPILCCHSYGVPLGLEWAKRHQISALVAIAGGTHNLDPWWEVPLMKFLTWGGRYLYRLPRVQHLTNTLSSSHRHDVMQRFFAESPVPTNVHPYKALEIFWGYNFFERHSTHWQLEIPCLVISGGQDPTFTADMGAELAANFPQGKHLHIKEAGHLVMAEYPQVINQAIAQFLIQHKL